MGELRRLGFRSVGFWVQGLVVKIECRVQLLGSQF